MIKPNYKVYIMTVGMLLAALLSYGQSGEMISGKVRDDSGVELPRANVLCKGTGTVVVSDIDGNFSIMASKGDTLVFSFIGYQSQEVVVADQSTLKIQLEYDIDLLDEVVVVGYGTLKKEDVTGAIGSVDSDDFNRGIVTNLSAAVVGKVSGVTVIGASGADPSALPNIRIRGSNSINLSSEPLYVIDGVPLEEGANHSIDPSTVERIDVLKDASASAIYGVRAANGVVMITTKQARDNKGGFRYEGSLGVQSMIRPFEYAPADELARIDNEIRISEGNAPLYTDEDIANMGKGTDWIDEGFRDAVFHNHSLSYNRAFEMQSVFASFSFTDREGILENTDFQRYNGTINYMLHATKKLQLRVNLRTSYVDANQNDFDPSASAANVVYGLLGTTPLLPAYNEDGSYGFIDGSSLRNPLPYLYDVQKQNILFTNVASLFANYQFTKTLSLNARLAYSHSKDERENFLPSTTREGAINEDGLVGRVELQDALSTSLMVEVFGKYKKIIKKHGIEVLLGATAQDRDKIVENNSAYGFTSDDVDYTNLSLASVVNEPIEIENRRKLLSGIARVNYSFDRKYNITASIRADGASVLEKGNQWGYFPSVSGAWWLTDESFAEPVSDFVGIKFRAGWGITGNIEGVRAGATSPVLFSNGVQYNFGNGEYANGLGLQGIPNSELVWETTTQTNFGTDLEFLEGNLQATVDVYHKLTDNLIFDAPVNAYNGFEVKKVTEGQVVNQGIEFGLSTFTKLANKVNLTFGGNISFNKNEVRSLPNGLQSLNTNQRVGIGREPELYNLLVVGQPISTFYGYVTDRIIQEGDNQTLQPDSGPGDYLFKDLNGDGVINENDRKILGNGLPVYTYGFNLRLDVHDFSLDAQFVGAYDVSRFNVNRADNENRFWSTALDRWTPVHTDTQIPQEIFWRAPDYGSFVADYFVEDASYLRIQNVSLRYLFLKNGKYVKDLMVTLTGQNLYTFTNYKGFDPESSTGTRNSSLGLDFNSYPQSRNFILSVAAKF